MTSSAEQDERSVEMSRRLNLVCVVGANVIVALMLAEIWGKWEGFEIAAGLQILLVPFNAWVTLKLLPRVGMQRAETLRAVVNVGCTAIIMHWADYPLAAWLWLPFVAMGFDHLGRRVALWLLVAMCATVDTTALLGGVPWIYPAVFTALAFYCFKLSEVRLGVVQDMLVESNERRRALAEANRELERTHEQLKREIEARSETETVARDMARQAGRAEIAAGVLHNVGNALHGFTMLSDLLDQGARASRAERLGDALRRLRELDAAGGQALLRDPKGAQLLGLLEGLAAQWRAETQLVLGHIGDLQNSVHHISAVIAKQQAYARPSAISELCLPQDVVRDAIVLTDTAKRRAGVHMEEHFECPEPVYLDRHRALEIMMNLLRNAEDAVLAHAPAAPCVRVSTRCTDGVLCVTVSDNGMGISSAEMARLFRYGYTTKEHGHGFGLHYCRALAEEVGGQLSCSSEGEGRGATFTLELPVTCLVSAAAA
jgi:signal transduction histidine kinase